MNKEQFLLELRKKLNRLPEAEIIEAMSYYEEYFADAGPENEQKVIAELSSPNAVAAKIIGEFALSDKSDSENGSAKSSAKTLWIVILAVLASPIALPVALALVITVLSLLFALTLTLFMLGVAGIMLGVAGIISIFVGFAGLFVSFGSGLFNVGGGLTALGLGTLMTLGIIKLGQLSVRGLQKLLASILVRKAA